MADQRRALVAERDHQVAQAARQAAEAVVAAARLRLAVAGEIGRDDGVVERQRLDHRLPVVGRPGHAVDEQQQGPLPRLQVTDPAAVDGDRLSGREACIDRWHGQLVPHSAADVTPRRPFSILSRGSEAPFDQAIRGPDADDRIPRGAIDRRRDRPARHDRGGGSHRRRRAAAKRRISNSSRRRRSPTPSRSPSPAARRRRCSWSTARSRRPGTNVAGYVALPGPLDREDRRRGADRRRTPLLDPRAADGHADRPELRRPADALPALLRRRASPARKSPKRSMAKFASHGHEFAYLEEVTEDMPEKFTTIEGVKVGWPEYEEGTEHILYHLPHGKAEGDGRTALLHGLENDRKRRPRRSPARSKPNSARRRWKPKARCRTLAADQRRSRRRSAGRTRRNRRILGRSGRRIARCMS